MRAVAIKKGQNREKAAGFPEMGTQARDETVAGPETPVCSIW